MGKFVHHEPCPNCGSRDNLARYSDGSAYCFGCKYVERGNVKYRMENPNTQTDDFWKDDWKSWTSSFSPKCLEWLAQYQIDVPTALQSGLKWHPEREQLIFPWFGPNGDLLAYQARNFGDNPKTKYFTRGDIQNLMPLYFKEPLGENTPTLVLVEDCISAIKCKMFTDAMPCLSSNLNRDKLARLSRLYRKFIVWLDSNMMTNSMKMCQALDYMGCRTTLIHTPLDPKCYSYDELKKWLAIK